MRFLTSMFNSLMLLVTSALLLAGRASAADDVSEMATVQLLAGKGVTLLAAIDPKDDTLIDVTVTVKRSPDAAQAVGPKIDSVGYAIYDRPVDETFCKNSDHSEIPVLEQKWTREGTLRFSFRAAASKNGYLVAKFKSPNQGAAQSTFDYIKLENIVSPP